ncbi:pyridoxal-phosphate dependent protein [Streptomyces sp. CB02923]|nr:pyridoxal-phosphate dependent protein [Streptomyces sp. CB02923]
MVRLRKLKTDCDSEILIKLESFNPGGSIKDRAALAMISQAERNGLLKPHGTIIESTSGNLGKSLALIGAAKGYRVILVIDPKAPRSMVDFVTALGAEIIMVDTPGVDGGFQRARIERVQQMLTVLPGAFWPDQYNNPENPGIHAEVTAREILEDVPDFDTLIAAVSTGGHLSGISTTVKRVLPHVRTIGVDALGSAVFGHPFTGYAMRGMGLAWRPGNLDLSVVDRYHMVSDHEGIMTAHMVAAHEGLLIGESAGAAVFAALHEAHRRPGSRIVVMAADGGHNYLSESFDPEWLSTRGIVPRDGAAPITTPQELLAAAAAPSHPQESVEQPLENTLVTS